METVKVEIQKLQLLNDRIAQTIDALNQLRMSVHGIQHTSVSPYGFGSPFTPYANPYATQFVPPQFGAFGQYGTQFPVGSPFGIQHSPMMGAYGTPFMPQQQVGIPQVPPQYAPQYTPQYTLPFVGNGISHTTLDPSLTLQARLAQTWPFTQTLS